MLCFNIIILMSVWKLTWLVNLRSFYSNKILLNQWFKIKYYLDVVFISKHPNVNCENVSTLNVVPQEKNVVFTEVRKRNNKVGISYCHYPTLDLDYWQYLKSTCVCFSIHLIVSPANSILILNLGLAVYLPFILFKLSYHFMYACA